MCGKDQLNLESYIPTTILICAEEERVKLSPISNTMKSIINKSVFRSTGMKMVVDMQSDFIRILYFRQRFLFVFKSFLFFF